MNLTIKSAFTTFPGLVRENIPLAVVETVMVGPT